MLIVGLVSASDRAAGGIEPGAMPPISAWWARVAA